ncbi:pectinesterase [Marivirga lumbricoides]|uniref:Pectinesterase n=1 Tax=Marivirga lumbricoides TaxID=1046115 RepID=A0ABQ1LCI2_9BACT|nr:pectinesterase [Marivirga lumbricoides]
MRLVVLIILFLFALTPAFCQTTVVVAADGSGEYTSLQAAIDASRAFAPGGVVIHLKNGIYKEKVTIPSWRTNISIIGEDAEHTIITWDNYSGQEGIHTFNSYTMKVEGNDFYAENITIQNTAGRDVGQGVALHVEADRAEFYNCRIIANQDTLYAGVDNSRQYYRNCFIEGTTDFIFGPATAVFDNCVILCKKDSYITAASTSPHQQFGFVFLHCELKVSDEAEKVYLGRPWRDYAKTVFINTKMDAKIRPEGWHNWKRPEAEKTVFYAEYNSTGKVAETAERVSWSKQLSKAEAKAYTIKNILSLAGSWMPKSIKN